MHKSGVYFINRNTKLEVEPNTSNMSFLRVNGTKIVDEEGQEVVLRGAGLGGWMIIDDQNPRVLKVDAFKHLDRAIAACAKHSVYTIIDLHSAPGGQSGGWHADAGMHIPTFWKHKDFQDRVVWLWKELATRYKNNPWVAGYNLLNEPADPTPNAQRLIGLYDRLFEAIRKEVKDEQHIIFLDGNTFATDFTAFPDDVRDGKRWPNTAFAIHDYAVEGFPGERGENYSGTPEEIEVIRQKYLRKRQWLDERGLCVWNGEWGPVYARKEYEGDQTEAINARREKVLRDQLAIYKEDKLSWSIWLYKDIGFQGMVHVSRDTAYMQHFRDFLARKHRLAVDAWGKDDTNVKQIYAPIEALIRESVADAAYLKLYPPLWSVQERVTRVSRTILFAEFLVKEWAEMFRGMDEHRLEELAKSFSPKLTGSKFDGIIIFTRANFEISDGLLVTRPLQSGTVDFAPSSFPPSLSPLMIRKQVPDLDSLESPLISANPLGSLLGVVPGSALAERIFNDPDAWHAADRDDDDGDLRDADTMKWFTDEVGSYHTDDFAFPPIDQDKGIMLKHFSEKLKLLDSPILDKPKPWEAVRQEKQVPVLPLFDRDSLELSLNVDLRFSKIWDAKRQTFQSTKSPVSPAKSDHIRFLAPPPLDLTAGDNAMSPLVTPLTVASASTTWSILELYGVPPKTPPANSRVPLLAHYPPTPQQPQLPIRSARDTPPHPVNTKLNSIQTSSPDQTTPSILTPIRRLPVLPDSSKKSTSREGAPERPRRINTSAHTPVRSPESAYPKSTTTPRRTPLGSTTLAVPSGSPPDPFTLSPNMTPVRSGGCLFSRSPPAGPRPRDRSGNTTPLRTRRGSPSPSREAITPVTAPVRPRKPSPPPGLNYGVPHDPDLHTNCIRTGNLLPDPPPALYHKSH
ncbi:hypothetical protein H0H93_007000 [Arthromyces matolae]|nr:hypothetical protein H0H93_007000 [Arthromyces matolae]